MNIYEKPPIKPEPPPNTIVHPKLIDKILVILIPFALLFYFIFPVMIKMIYV